MMSSCRTFRLNRRSALSRVSASWRCTSAKKFTSPSKSQDNKPCDDAIRVPPGCKVHGHRGARAIRPENTLPGFEYAIAVGADAIELDVRLAENGLIAVSHDPVPIGATSSLATLDQVLDLAPRGDFLFDIEIKSSPDHPELARLVLDRV